MTVARIVGRPLRGRPPRRGTAPIVQEPSRRPRSGRLRRSGPSFQPCERHGFHRFGLERPAHPLQRVGRPLHDQRPQPDPHLHEHLAGGDAVHRPRCGDRRAARRVAAAKTHRAHPAARPFPGHPHRRPARPSLPDVRVRHHPGNAAPAAQGLAVELLHGLPPRRADHQRRRHAEYLSRLRRPGEDAGGPGPGAPDGRPVDDGPPRGPRLPRGHWDKPDRRMAVSQARQQTADAAGRAERVAAGGRGRAGNEAADRRAHHQHRADEPARLRGHHGLLDPRRPDRVFAGDAAS